MRHFLHELFCCYMASQDDSTFSLLKNQPYFYIFACHIHNLVYLLLLHYIKLIKRIIFSNLVCFFNFHPFFYRFFFQFLFFYQFFIQFFIFCLFSVKSRTVSDTKWRRARENRQWARKLVLVRRRYPPKSQQVGHHKMLHQRLVIIFIIVFNVKFL